VPTIGIKETTRPQSASPRTNPRNPMHHRHLNHTEFTLAAIEDILARGQMPDWVPLITAIRADPHGEIAEKTLL
jgi:hypothetical protein